MATVYKREVKDWRGEVIGVDVGRFFPIEAHAAADHAETLLNAINPLGFVPFGDKGEPFDPPEPWPSDKAATWVGPPNCEGYGHTLAHAQHEAAIDGDGCTAGACLLTRGSD